MEHEITKCFFGATKQHFKTTTNMVLSKLFVRHYKFMTLSTKLKKKEILEMFYSRIQTHLQ